MNYIAIFIIGICMGSAGGILTKMGADELGSIKISNISDALNFIIKMIFNWKIVLGLFLYLSSALLWTYLLTKLDISFVQPILALTYVVTPILAILLLGEAVPIVRWVGIITIIIGVFIVSKTV